MSVVITGATSGIGLWIAKRLAADGHDLVLVGRDPQKLAQTLDTVRADAQLHVALATELADLASFAQVDALAARLLARGTPRVLINNAGLFMKRKLLTIDGLETTMAVNHFSVLRLTARLLPAMRARGGTRIINVNSVAHERVQLRPADLEPDARFSLTTAYSKSKLASMMTTIELAARVPAGETTINAVHPGAVATNFGEVGGGLQFLWRLAKPLMLTSAQGADTPVYLAESRDVASRTGDYFVKRRSAPINPQIRDATVRRAIWQRSLELAGLPADVAPETSTTVRT